MTNNIKTSEDNKLKARDLMVVLDAIKSVQRVQGVGAFHDLDYATAGVKIINILEQMEVPEIFIAEYRGILR